MYVMEELPEVGASYHGTTSQAYPAIISMLSDEPEDDSRVGGMRERLNVTVVSENPRDRMLRRPGINWAFGLQEAFAYWNGLNPGYVQRYNSQMENYMRDGELEGSAYGRYFRKLPHDQIQRVIDQLTTSPETRRAVINVHNAKYEDYDGPDVACTIYLQFILRDGELNLIANMRSQDMLWGYPYDVQAFQWLQEVVAGILDADLGRYVHTMNSCHYYTEFEKKVISSKNNATSTVLPDCRLDERDLDNVMQTLGTVLWFARNGYTVDHFLDQLDDVSTFYGDWARVMLAYEHRRFHENEDYARDVIDNITVDAFADWI